MTVSEIWEYPIKGLGGQKVSSAKALESGFQHDRRFMLVDRENKFISQRTHSSLAKLSVKIDANTVEIYDKVNGRIGFKFDINAVDQNSNLISKVWSSKVEANPFIVEVNNWFSEFLNDDVKLVVQKEFGNRNRSIPFIKQKIQMSFADGYPYLVLSLALPYQEDDLKSFSITDAKFRMVKPCKRCPVINIHQDTGEKTVNVTKELLTYRKVLNSVIFGMNAANLKEGIVNVGDELQVG